MTITKTALMGKRIVKNGCLLSAIQRFCILQNFIEKKSKRLERNNDTKMRTIRSNFYLNSKKIIIVDVAASGTHQLF